MSKATCLIGGCFYMGKKMFVSKLGLTSCVLMAVLTTGCATMTGKGQESSVSGKNNQKQSGKVDASASSGGERKVKGRGDWEGYISGQPWKGAKFSRLEIGMSYRQVLSLIGPPTDQYSHVTGKAWIPFYYGSGRYEHKLLYKGQGRLVFAGDAGFSSNAHLIGIEFNRNESGYH